MVIIIVAGLVAVLTGFGTSSSAFGLSVVGSLGCGVGHRRVVVGTWLVGSGLITALIVAGFIAALIVVVAGLVSTLVITGLITTLRTVLTGLVAAVAGLILAGLIAALMR